MLRGHERHRFCLPAAWLQRSLLECRGGKGPLYLPQAGSWASVCAVTLSVRRRDFQPSGASASVSLLTFHPELRPLQSSLYSGLSQFVRSSALSALVGGGPAAGNSAGDCPRVRTMGAEPPALFSLSLPSEDRVPRPVKVGNPDVTAKTLLLPFGTSLLPGVLEFERA